MQSLRFDTNDIDAAVADLAARQSWQRPQYENAGRLLKNIRVSWSDDGKLIFHEQPRPVEVVTVGPARNTCTCQIGDYLRCVRRMAAEIIAQIDGQAGAAIELQPRPDERGPAGAMALLAHEVGV